MRSKQILLALSVLTLFGCQVAKAGSSREEAGALVCVTDKWVEKEVEKGHKYADAVMRCVAVPDDPALEKYAQECTGKYEYLPDGSWKSTGECRNTYKNGDKSTETWEEGSALKEYTYKKTGGTGRYEGLGGGGTYMYEPVTDVLFGGRYKGTLIFAK